MNVLDLNGQLRRTMLLLAGAVFLATPLELVFAKHYDEPAQFIPFVLALLGLVVILRVLRRPDARTIQALRWVMGLEIAGSLVGMALHLSGNWEFIHEVQANASTSQMIWKTLTGAAPLLAPGILALAGMLGLTATYRYFAE